MGTQEQRHNGPQADKGFREHTPEIRSTWDTEIGTWEQNTHLPEIDRYLVREITPTTPTRETAVRLDKTPTPT